MTMTTLDAMNILVAPDKFKGTLTALEVAEAIRVGWQSIRPQDEFTLTPMADGGTGTAPVVAAVLAGCDEQTARVADALGRDHTTSWLALPDGRALIEAASAVGVDLLRPAELDPLAASSYGVGQLLIAARQSGGHETLVGLGGTANIDGGTGMAVALGHRLLTNAGTPIEPTARGMSQVDRIELGPAFGSPLTVLSDVRNPLLGPDGAAAVYGPQKGVAPRDIAWFEDALARFADVVERDVPGGPWRDLPGAGAAGGLGFALSAFCGAEFRNGAEAVAELVGFDEALTNAEVVITGEGKLDAQTSWGKTPGYVAERARFVGASVFAIAGIIEQGADRAFDASLALGPEGLARPAELVTERAAELARRF